MIFGTDEQVKSAGQWISKYPLDRCLTCGEQIREKQWEDNNGVCDDCPKLTQIAPAFWKVINHLALKGDLDAQATMVKYG